MNILTAGCSGLIGTELINTLTSRGDSIIQLVRRAPRSDRERQWDPAKGTLESAHLDGIDAVTCLSGVGVADKRWTPARRQAILSSRIDSVGVLARAIAAHSNPPKVFISASAIGYYGSSLSETEHNESSEPGNDFLADVCVQWEDAAAPAREATRCVQARIGVVLSTQGGALQKMLPPFRMGVGGPLGTGRQIMSWISLADVVGGIVHTIDNEALSGPVNLVSPNPLSNAELSRSLASALHRPCLFKAPAFAIRTALGEMGETLLLNGSKVVPSKLQNTEFRFQHATIQQVWESEFA